MQSNTHLEGNVSTSHQGMWSPAGATDTLHLDTRILRARSISCALAKGLTIDIGLIKTCYTSIEK
jgi:hypothetical protein